MVEKQKSYKSRWFIAKMNEDGKSSFISPG